MSLPASPAIKTKPRPPLPFIRTGRSRIPLLAFGFVFAFVVSCTFLIVINPSISSPRWLNALLSSTASRSATLPPISPLRSQNVTSPAPLHPPPGEAPSASPPPEKDSSRKKKKKRSSGASSKSKKKKKQCNVFEGRWVRDESYHPFYSPGSCPHIDEPFNCYVNGRPDSGFLKYRWQPNGCNVPSFDAQQMFKLLRGKRLVYVGDSLNRNMWESLVCMLRSSVKDKSRVFEASGRHEFRTEGSYSFIFKDYNCSVEFFRSTFLVREWEVEDKNGTKRETLRLDMVEESSPKYKDADILIFNTGHWWTHAKTSNGKGYYQEADHVYDELSGDIAFKKALTTWGKWIDTNINAAKTTVFFRGYSPSHFRGGVWNTGGQCDKEHLPILSGEVELNPVYAQQMRSFEEVSRRMKTRVYYLNITGLSNYRIDAHPSVYREENATEEQRWSPLIPQDCSHWCLPGIPDTWNQLLYHQLLLKYNDDKTAKKKKKKKTKTKNKGHSKDMVK